MLKKDHVTGCAHTTNLSTDPQVLAAARSAFEAGAQTVRQTHLRGRRDLSLLLAQSAVQVTSEPSRIQG